jgi:CheY-like chemotaxis protein
MSKVLIVDDNEDMRFLIMSTLKNNGFDEVDEASSGAEAVFLAGQDQPNVVILDYMMPGMDGERTAKIDRPRRVRWAELSIARTASRTS